MACPQVIEDVLADALTKATVRTRGDIESLCDKIRKMFREQKSLTEIGRFIKDTLTANSKRLAEIEPLAKPSNHRTVQHHLRDVLIAEINLLERLQTLSSLFR